MERRARQLLEYEQEVCAALLPAWVLSWCSDHWAILAQRSFSLWHFRSRFTAQFPRGSASPRHALYVGGSGECGHHVSCTWVRGEP